MPQATIKSVLFALAVLIAGSAQAANPRVALETNFGTVTIELYPRKAPMTVANFLRYVKDGHYDGTIFHRVINGFMIQGGEYTPSWRAKPTGAPIRNEADNGLDNASGTVAMARTADPNSAKAQFFINLADNRFLDFRSPTTAGYGYCVFGRVVAGMGVVRRIGRVPTQAGPPPHQNVPVHPVVIERAEILKSPPQPAK